MLHSTHVDDFFDFFGIFFAAIFFNAFATGFGNTRFAISSLVMS